MEVENEEKKERKKIIVLFIFVLFAAIFAGTTSYAWFTINRIVTIESLNVRIQASGGIEVSTDGIDWKNSVNEDDIIAAHETYRNSVNQLPSSMDPVSTVGDIENGFMKMYYGITDNPGGDEYILYSTRTIETESNGDDSEGRFLAFDVFFKTDNPSEIYLTPESKITFASTEENPGLENSVRFAFVMEGSVSTDASINNIQNLKEATNDDVYIWEPNYDTHSETGILNAKELFDLDLSESGNNYIRYSGIKTTMDASEAVLISEATASKYPQYFREVNVDFYTKTNFLNNIHVFSLPAGITKIRVYIWVEGQDVDCENGSSTGNLELNFQLTTNMS